MHKYQQDFFDHLAAGSVASARTVVPLLKRWLPIRSVLDVGCGQGAWLKVWQEHNTEIHGLDGDYIDQARLLIPAGSFRPTDLTRPFELGCRFDLVSCLEVAEHLPDTSAGGLVRSICAHGDVVLFSAAPPGQGGTHHVNEQPYGYWRARFESLGYCMLDGLRPQLAHDPDVEPWYRYNMFLYVRETRLASMPPQLAATRVARGVEPSDVSPTLYRLRKVLIRALPTRAVDRLAVLKRRWAKL